MWAEQYKTIKLANLVANTANVTAGSATYTDLVQTTAMGQSIKRNLKIIYGAQVTSIGSSGVWTLTLSECDTTAGTYTTVTTAGGASDDYPGITTSGVGEFHVKVTKRYLAYGVTDTTSGVLTGTPTANIIIMAQFLQRETQG